MAPTKKSDPVPESKKPTQKMGGALCGGSVPGPQYKMKALVGYKDHCLSKLKNPAYSLGMPLFFGFRDYSPGTKYAFPPPKKRGFSIGLPLKDLSKLCTPGPYSLKSPEKRPAYSMKWRTKFRGGCATPGPYPAKSTLGPPSFSLGLKLDQNYCTGVPGPQNAGDLNAVKPRAPRYSIAHYVFGPSDCATPGPKYKPEILKRSPKYSFGIRHHECSPPNFTSCDDLC